MPLFDTLSDTLCDKLSGDHAALPPRAAYRAVVLAGLGAGLVIFILTTLSGLFPIGFLLGSFGASCLLVFAFPDVPFSQPRNVVLGHTLSSIIGVAMVAACGAHPWVLALAVAACVVAMMLTRTVHPPAASNPVIVYLAQPALGWGFVLFPTLAGALVLVAVALLYHNLTRKSRYPKYW